MGAAALPMAIGAGASFLGAKLSGADTGAALGAGLLGGATGYFGGMPGAISGAGSMFGGGSSAVSPQPANTLGGATSTPYTNPFLDAATGGSPPISSSGLGGTASTAKPMVTGGSNQQEPKVDWWNELGNQLMNVGSIYSASEELRRKEEEEARLRALAAAEIQQSLYRPAPSPSFAPAVGLGSFPGVGGGFARGR